MLVSAHHSSLEKQESRIVKLQLGVFSLKEKLAKKAAKSSEAKSKKAVEISGLQSKILNLETQYQLLSSEKNQLTLEVKNLSSSIAQKDQQIQSSNQENTELKRSFVNKAESRGEVDVYSPDKQRLSKSRACWKKVREPLWNPLSRQVPWRNQSSN